MRKTNVYNIISKDILLVVYFSIMTTVDSTHFLQKPSFHYIPSNIIVLLFFIILLAVINL